MDSVGLRSTLAARSKSARSGMIIVPPLVQRLSSIAHTKFPKAVVLMFVDGREADPKTVGDFLEGKTFCNQCHDFVLAHGQR